VYTGDCYTRSCPSKK